MSHAVTLAGAAILLVASAFGPAAVTARAQPAGDAALCGTNEPCRVTSHNVGRDAAGRALRVVELVIGEDSEDAACRPHRQQYWLFVAAEAPRLVFDLCKEGPGSGIEEDEVTLRPNRLIHRRAGGSSWRFEATRTVELSPLRVLSDNGNNNWLLSSNIAMQEWSWTRFAGMTRWWAPACGREDDRPRDVNNPGALPYAYAPIPRFSAEALPAGVADAELGSFALNLDATGVGGFVSNAPSARANEPHEWMRTLILGEVGRSRELMVTIGGARWRPGGAANWIHDDHLELWLGPLSGYGQTCLPTDAHPRQWGIRIADGRVFAGHRATAAGPRVLARRERAAGNERIVTFRVALPEQETETLTVVLARGDGRRQGRMLATSRLRFGRLQTLGTARDIPPAAVRCELRDGRLELVESGRPDILREMP